MIEIEASSDLPDVDVAPLCAIAERTCAEVGITRATLGIMVIDEARMAEINGEHRDKPRPTDVLSFPVDGPVVRDGWPEDGPPPELGDIIICPAAAEDPLSTLVIHGLLHLIGYDHEVDNGEMLELQDQLVDRLT